MGRRRRLLQRSAAVGSQLALRRTRAPANRTAQTAPPFNARLIMRREAGRLTMQDRGKFILFRLLFTILAVLPLAGCAGYHLGPVNPAVHAGDTSIEIVPFQNRTLQPRLADAVTQALRERIQSDGTYHLARNAEADVIVTGTITGYSRKPVSFLNTDVTTPKNYRIEI